MEADQREVQRDLRDGGIRGLVAFATERWPAIEADFQRFYGLDARYCRGAVRRFKALLDHLPHDQAAVWQIERDARDRVRGGWSLETELAAQTVEMLHTVYRTQLVTHGVKSHDLPKPHRIPRPGDKKQQGPRRVSPLELIDRLRRG